MRICLYYPRISKRNVCSYFCVQPSCYERSIFAHNSNGMRIFPLPFHLVLAHYEHELYFFCFNHCFTTNPLFVFFMIIWLFRIENSRNGREMNMKCIFEISNGNFLNLRENIFDREDRLMSRSSLKIFFTYKIKQFNAISMINHLSAN